MTTPVITIDGPEASGKGTLARALADRLGFFYFDTGAMYRLTALRVLKAGLDPDDAMTAAAEAKNLAAVFTPAMAADPSLRTAEVGQTASKIAQHPQVRDALLQIQRDLGTNPPKPFKGTVMDGRDAGTVICPDAPLKIYLTANASERAQRRTKELLSRGFETTYEAVLQALEERDKRDSTRSVAPLKPAQDAATVSSNGMDADQVLDAVMALVRDRLPGIA